MVVVVAVAIAQNFFLLDLVIFAVVVVVVA